MPDQEPSLHPRVVTRFAPSPTGYLHAGHAYSARLNHELARNAGGRFLLRIDDIDTRRCTPELERAVIEDLTWLGLSWDDKPLRQSERTLLYEGSLAVLHDRGLVYRCFRSRADVEEAISAPHDTVGQAFRSGPLATIQERDNLAVGRPFAWRLSLDAVAAELGPEYDDLTYTEGKENGLTQQPAEPWRFGDVVLGRKDSGTTYHLSSVVDDAAQGVTHVMRGEELREAAGLHALLCRLFGFASPVYVHHELIMDSNGERLSKRANAMSLRTMRESGTWPSELFAGLER